MKRSRGWMTLLIFSASLCDMPIAVAQVPPHEPGTICFTKKFWCWANPTRPAQGPVHVSLAVWIGSGRSRLTPDGAYS